MDLASWMDGIEERDWASGSEGTVRFALIGLGWWTIDVALPAIAASERCETTVLVSSSTEKATSVAADHDIPHGISYEAYHEGEVLDAYDAVYIGTPNAYHRTYAETAAEHGKAILCEKPIEATLAEAEAMVEACTDVPFMAAYRLQTDPLARRARELVRAGAIGEPRYVYGTKAQPLLSMIPDPDQWRLDPERTGYGTSVMDLGIYVLNTARFVLDRDPVEAFARMESRDDPFEGVPDQLASYSLALEGGVPLVGTTSQDAQRESTLLVTGSAGRVQLEPAFSGEVVLHVERGDASVRVAHDALDVEREMREEFEYFADRVLTGEPIGPDGEHALVDMRTIAAIHRSAETGTPVPI